MIGDKTRVLFLFQDIPSVVVMERVEVLEKSGEFEPHIAYWSSPKSKSILASGFSLPSSRYHPIELNDAPKGVLKRFAMICAFSYKLKRLVEDLKPEIVHAIQPTMLVAALLVSLYFPKFKLNYELFDISRKSHMFFDWILLRLACARIESIFSSSPRFSTDYLRQIGGERLCEKHIYLSNAPVSWKKLPDLPSKDELVVGCFGTMRCREQIKNLVRVVEELNEEGVGVRAVFAGIGVDADIIETAAQRSESIDYQGAYDYRREIADLYSRCNVIYAVYPQEVLNYRIHIARRFHEAILTGRRVLVSKGSYMEDCLNRYSGLGLAISDSSIVELREALKSLIINRSAAPRIESQNLKKHSFDYYSNALLNSYRRLSA